MLRGERCAVRRGLFRLVRLIAGWVLVVAGAILAAAGVAVIAVLTLRAMSEWNAQAPLRQRRQ